MDLGQSATPQLHQLVPWRAKQRQEERELHVRLPKWQMERRSLRLPSQLHLRNSGPMWIATRCQHLRQQQSVSKR